MQSQEPEHISCDELPVRDQRTVVFYLLYGLDVSSYEMTVESLIAQFGAGFACNIAPEGGIAQRARLIALHRDQLDAEIKPLLHNWKLERLSVSTRLILRLAIWELKNTEIDVPIIINEALELAKSFAEADAHKFINGVLDEWVKRNRTEMAKRIPSEIPESQS